MPEEEPPLAKREKTTLLDPAPAGEATYLYVALTAPDTELMPPKGQPSALLASWPLPSRGTVWIVGWQGEWDGFRAAFMAALPQMREKCEQSLGQTLLPGQTNEARAVLWTDPDKAGVPHIIEVGVEYGRS